MRIFPYYWISIAVMIVALLLFGRSFSKFVAEDPGYLVKQVILIGINLAELWGSDARLNGPAWTLDIEFQYYALAPFIVLGWQARPRTVVALVAIVMVVGCSILWRGTGLVAVDRSLLAWSPLFGAGLLAALYPDRARKLLVSFGLLLACGLVVVVAARTIPTGSVLTLVCALTLTAVAAHLLIGSSPTPAGPIDKLCGDLSYPVYVFHTILPSLYPVVALSAAPTFANWLYSFLLILAAAVAMSLVVHFAIGVRLDRWRAGLRATRTRRVSVAEIA